MAGAESYAISLLGVMDRLWFHQVVLFSEPNSILAAKTLGKVTPNLPPSESLTNQYSSMCSIPEDEIFSMASSGSITNQPEDQTSEKELDDIGKELAMEERPTIRSKVRSQSSSSSSSSSPSTPTRHSRSKLKYYSSSVTRLQKTMSCKSLSELEEEEIKGFTDLGFSFDKQNICPKMMSVLPGLQRLGGGRGDNDPHDHNSEKDEEEDWHHDDDEEKIERHGDQVFRRPYLSEAWLIKRPDSPLLNLRVPRVSSAAEMKKHLRYWARTVASEIHQVS